MLGVIVTAISAVGGDPFAWGEAAALLPPAIVIGGLTWGSLINLLVAIPADKIRLV